MNFRLPIVLETISGAIGFIVLEFFPDIVISNAQ